MEIALAAGISFLATYTVLPAIIFLARKYNCLDTPGVRRFHSVSMPKWGGGAFFLGVLPAFLFFLPLNRETLSFLAASFLLVGMGLWDDYRPLGWKGKFSGIALATTIVVFGSHAVINHVGAYGSIGLISLGPLAVPFTYFCVLGVTNAFNLSDGLNGLAGGTALLCFFFLGIGAMRAGNETVAVIAFAFTGVLTAFLPFNFPQARIFMGDSGSLFLGFSLAVLSIFLTQGPASPVSPMYPVLVLLIPIFDTLRLLFLRSLKKKNPFQADKGHLHHLLVRRGVSSPRTVVLLWSLSALCGLIALGLAEKPSSSIFVAVCYGTVFLSAFVVMLARRRRKYEAAYGREGNSVKPRSLLSLFMKLW
jgi:UDP-GlcNAc:undecaprenyl-phosphate GlcNAc-1-phosphate transferase